MTTDAGLRDRLLIYAAGFVRAAATALTGVLVGIYLARIDFTPSTIGGIVTAGLAGGALAALIATFVADRFGRRRFLVVVAALTAAGGVIVALGSGPAVITAAAFFGMLNGMGKDRGAAMVIEQAVLPATTTDDRRTAVFATASVLQAIGAALGALMAGLPTLFHRAAGISPGDSIRLVMLIYAALSGLTAIFYLGLSPRVESETASLGIGHVTLESRHVVFKLSALFSLDALGSGFLTNSLVAFFFAERFGVSAGIIGSLYFIAGILNALSQFAAAWLARRIGLINTMVYTHIPSSIFLMLIPLAPNFAIAAALFLARESLVQMDVPTRQSYVMAVVKPEERTFAAGVTSLVRLTGWAVAPGFAGLFMETVSLGAPLVIGPALKIVYDLLLFRAFRHVKPPEETSAKPDKPARAHA